MSYSQQGPAAQVLQLINVDLPQPGPGQVRVQIAYSAVNPTDVKTRSGMTGQSIEQPQIPHMDGSGIIDAVGEGVSPSRIGERVWLMLVAFGSTWGTAAEAIIVDSARAIELPAHITLKHAATIAVPSLTAAYCLFQDGSLTDRNVLIQGGAGGVGRAAIQLAALGGARVYATASTPAKQEIARTAGAHLVVDYRDPQAAEKIMVASGGIDRIIELNLGVNLELDLAVIRTGSSIVTYAADATDPQIPVRRLMMACVDLRFMILYNITPAELANAIGIVSSALERGAVTIPPTRVFALEECVDAHVAQEAGPDSRLLLLVNELE
jgi:NADPH:quinone reductase